jgi:hypothetical protein
MVRSPGQSWRARGQWPRARDRVDAREATADRLRVAEVGLDVLGSGVDVLRPVAMCERQERVEDACLGAELDERVDDVRADEAAAAGDEERSTPATRSCSSGARIAPCRVRASWASPRTAVTSERSSSSLV